MLADHDDAGRAAPEIPPPPTPRRSVETKNRQLDAVGDDALDVLREQNEAGDVPVVFRRGLGTWPKSPFGIRTMLLDCFSAGLLAPRRQWGYRNAKDPRRLDRGRLY
ncbi:MAG: hypothetical protein ACE5EL_06240 [Anaerolineae bacterium]